MEKSICIPTYVEENDANVNSDDDINDDDDHIIDYDDDHIKSNDAHRYHSSEYHNNENNDIKKIDLLPKNNHEKKQKYESVTDMCFSIELSIPDFPTNPVFEFKNSWAIEEGTAGMMMMMMMMITT
jgi:uncharacterized protein YjdB